MTRRKFIQKILKTCLFAVGITSSVIASVSEAISRSRSTKCYKRLPRRFAPRNDHEETLKESLFDSKHKFVWANHIEKFPGSLKPLRDISKQDNWSG